MSIRLLHLITELATGGAQISLLRLLEHLDRQRYDIQVACLYNGEREIAQKIRALGIPVTDLGMRTKWHWGAFIHLFRLVKKFKPHILHTWMFHANIPGRILGRLAGVPIIVNGERTMGMEKHWRMYLNHLTGALADRILCVSEHVAQFAREEIGLPAEKLVVIPNGIEMDAFSHLPSKEAAREILGLPREGLLVGSIGRSQQVKGFDILIESFQQFASQFHTVHLIFAGSGPEFAALQSQASRWDHLGQIIFLGNVDDVRPVLAALDIYVQPSRYEGMPNAVLEAMASGLPVVASAVGGIPEIVQDHVTGVLVPPQQVSILTAALKSFLMDANTRMRFGRAGREFIRQYYPLTETVAKTEAVYFELIQSKLTGRLD